MDNEDLGVLAPKHANSDINIGLGGEVGDGVGLQHHRLYIPHH